MKYISLFSGIEAASSAWKPLGWEPMAFSEIEAFPCAVLAHHYPTVPNHGDVTKFDWSVYRGKCDVLIGGSPCQSFSVAGLRGSLDDARGNLALAFCMVVHAIDPTVVVYENVPGLLNTKDNAFGCFLAGLVGEGEPLVCGQQGWRDAGMAIGPRRSAAWRVLDAQYVGLAQRRRRVFVVSFRTRDGHNPGAVLFESESLPRDTPPGREAGAGVAGTFAPRTHGGGGLGTDFECDGGLTVSSLTTRPYADNESNESRLIPQVFGGGNCSGPLDVAACLTARGQRIDFEVESFAVQPVAIQEDNQNGVTIRDTTGSLRSDAPGSQPCGTLVGVPVQPIPLFAAGCEGNRNAGVGQPGDPAFCLDQLARGQGVAYGIHSDAIDRTGEGAAGTAGERSGLGISEDLSPCLNAKRPNAVAFNWQSGGSKARLGFAEKTTALQAEQTPAVLTQMAVRRLTPTECERLQGFRDGFTAVPYRGKPAADGPRYRALGNSMAVPVVRWIGERIAKVLDARAG